MKLLLILAISVASAHAEESFAAKIVAEMFHAELFWPVEASTAEEAESRKVAIERIHEITSRNLQEMMSEEELRISWEFISSPAGKSFQRVINSDEILKGINEVFGESQRESQNQAEHSTE